MHPVSPFDQPPGRAGFLFDDHLKLRGRPHQVQERIAPVWQETWFSKADEKTGGSCGQIEITEDQPMNLKDWEPTIQQIADESNHEPTEAGKHKVLIAWRAKLEKEPTSLPLFQIDQIVRAVRNRLTVAIR